MGDFDLNSIGFDENSLLSMVGSNLANAETVLGRLENAGRWFEYKARGTPEADAVLTPPDKAHGTATGVLFPRSEREVLDAPANMKQNFFKFTDKEVFGVERGTEQAFREMLENAVIAQDEEHVIPFNEWAANYTFVPIKAELWVAVINHIALQILKTNPESKADEKENGSNEVRQPTETTPASLKDRVTIRTNDPLRDRINAVKNLHQVMVLIDARARQREAEDIKKAITVEVLEENLEIRREAQGLGGTPANKAAADENPVERIQDSEGTVEKERAEETPIEKIKDSEGVVEKKLNYDHDHPTDKPHQSR